MCTEFLVSVLYPFPSLACSPWVMELPDAPHTTGCLNALLVYDSAPTGLSLPCVTSLTVNPDLPQNGSTTSHPSQHECFITSFVLLCWCFCCGVIFRKGQKLGFFRNSSLEGKQVCSIKYIQLVSAGVMSLILFLNFPDFLPFGFLFCLCLLTTCFSSQQAIHAAFVIQWTIVNGHRFHV